MSVQSVSKLFSHLRRRSRPKPAPSLAFPSHIIQPNLESLHVLPQAPETSKSHPLSHPKENKNRPAVRLVLGCLTTGGIARVVREGLMSVLRSHSSAGQRIALIVPLPPRRRPLSEMRRLRVQASLGPVLVLLLGVAFW